MLPSNTGAAAAAPAPAMSKEHQEEMGATAFLSPFVSICRVRPVNVRARHVLETSLNDNGMWHESLLQAMMNNAVHGTGDDVGNNGAAGTIDLNCSSGSDANIGVTVAVM